MRRMMVMGMGITGRAVTTALQRRDIDVIAPDDLDHCEVVDWCSHWCSIRAGGKSSSPELKCRV